jgi:hypothetical protein
MPVSFGLLLVGTAVIVAITLDRHVSRHRTRCTEMLGMMVGMAAGMTTGLIIGEVAGFFMDMFLGNLLAILFAVPLGGYLGRHGRLLGMLDGAMAGLMGGMMGAMLGVMLKFPPEHALYTGIVLVGVQCLALVSVGYLVQRACALPALLPGYYEALGVDSQATSREIVAAYLAATDPANAPLPEQLRFADEALRVLSDPFHRVAYDQARAASAAPGSQPGQGAEASVSGIAAMRPGAWTTIALVGFAIVAFNHVSNQPVTCPPPASAQGLPSPTALDASQRQVVNLTVQFPCYNPERITVRRGVPVEMHIGAVGEPGCGRQVVLRGLGVSTIIVPGKIATVEFTPEQAGTYSINCGMSMMKTAILAVTE